MKIQFLTAYYHHFLENFLAVHPGLVNKSYNQILDLLLEQYFADTGATHAHFLKKGYESTIIISNFELLQKKWAEENAVSFSSENWRFEIALAQVKAFRPDFFFIESIFDFYGEFISSIKSQVRVVAAWISTPFADDLNLKNIDLFFSSTPDFVNKFKKIGTSQAEYVLPAFDARVLTKVKQTQQKNITFSFVGGWSDNHIKRKESLIKLVEETPLKIWGYGYTQKHKFLSKSYIKDFFFNENKRIQRAYQKEVWGLEMYNVLKDSLITFNIHEELLKGYVGNMRMFEATGVGTMLLNDNGTNLSSLFEIGKEIETYSTIDEAIEKVNYYIKNPQKAIEIGLNAQKRTLANYNYDVFTETIGHFLNKQLL